MTVPEILARARATLIEDPRRLQGMLRRGARFLEVRNAPPPFDVLGKYNLIEHESAPDDVPAGAMIDLTEVLLRAGQGFGGGARHTAGSA